MLNKIFVDTSFIIALVNERDQYHRQAESLSYKLEKIPLITTDAVLLEIGNALARGYRKEALQIINVLRQGKNVEVRSI